MDSPSEIEAIITRASECEKAMKYDEAISMLKPLLRRKIRKTLTPIQEIQIVGFVAISYRKSGKYKETLPLAKQYVDLTENYRGDNHSTLHILALNELASIYVTLNLSDLAYETIRKAELAIKDSALSSTAEYCWSMIYVLLGSLELQHKKPNEALAAYNKSKLVLIGMKNTQNTSELADILNKIATCHKLLGRWNEGLGCYKEAIKLTKDLAINNSDNNSDSYNSARIVYATSLSNLGYNYARLKQPEKAIPMLEECYAIFQSLYGDKNEIVETVKGTLLEARGIKTTNKRTDISEEHNFRMCNTCETIKENMDVCPACNHAWYCDDKCQLEDWPSHKLKCNWCANCQSTRQHTQMMSHCSTCKKVKYCDAQCQKTHWRDHKPNCNPTKK